MSYLRPVEILEPINLHYLIESREDSYAYLSPYLAQDPEIKKASERIRGKSKEILKK